MNLDALLDPLAIGVLLVLAAVYPWMSVWEYRRLVRWTAEGLPDARLRHYNWIIASEWVTVVVFLAWWFLAGRPAEPLGLVPDPVGWQWLAVAGGLALSALLVLQTVTITGNPEALTAASGNFADLADMAPRNAKEDRAFIRLSVTAGICEEILYRGLALAILAAAIGTWPAVLVSSILFGFAHIYQGPLGFVKTGSVGLLMAILTVFSGSLFTAVIVHIVIDVGAGRLMAAARALTERRPAGPAATPER